MEPTETPQQRGGIYNYFQGATINNLVINGNMTKSGTEHYYGAGVHKKIYSDSQVARALCNIVGKGKAIDSKQKWAGAHWLLRWLCDFPARPFDFCERVNSLPLPEELEIKCEYHNIRQLSTLSFMNEDPRNMESVKYNKNDENVFFQMREVVTALSQELQKTTEMEL